MCSSDLVRARLEGDHRGAAAGAFPGLGERVHLGVRAAGRGRGALSHHRAGGVQHDGTDGWVGAGGAEQAEAEDGALAAWLTGAREHRPHVVWKVATTLDGRVAAADGTSRWITGPDARAAVHRLRATCDAVLVGSGTALADDPQLTVRDAEGRNADRQPLRVVLDRRSRVPATARVHDAAARTLVSRAATPGALLAELFDSDVRRVLLEGGPTLAAAFLAAGLVDEAVVHVAPVLLGAGAPMVGGLGISTITDALHLQVTDVTRIGGDVQIRLRPTRHTGGPGTTGGGS